MNTWVSAREKWKFDSEVWNTKLFIFVNSEFALNVVTVFLQQPDFIFFLLQAQGLSSAKKK
jgi:hypothetical protein